MVRRVFELEVEELMGMWRKLHSEGVYNLYFSQSKHIMSVSVEMDED